MSEILTSRSPSRRKASVAHATGYTSPSLPNRAADPNHNTDRDSLSTKKSLRRRERNKDSSDGKTRIGRGMSRSHHRGSSSELMASKGENTTLLAAEYEKVCVGN